MTNSREKGKRGERWVAKMFTSEGYEARRGQQFKGDPTAPDVIVDPLPWLHVEVKDRERHTLWADMAKAEEDASSTQVPVVFSHMNRKPWLVTMTTTDWFSFLRRYVLGGAGGALIKPQHELTCDMDEDCTCEPRLVIVDDPAGILSPEKE